MLMGSDKKLQNVGKICMIFVNLMIILRRMRIFSNDMRSTLLVVKRKIYCNRSFDVVDLILFRLEILSPIFWDFFLLTCIIIDLLGFLI